MIQQNEIRLGNWVLDDEGSWSRIIGFKPYDHSVRCDEDEGCYILFDRLHKGEWDKGWVTENANLHPIPLTEEVLLKCGFEIVRFTPPSQTTGSDLYYGYDYAIIKIGHKTELIIRFRKDRFKIEGFYSSDLKSLHQLQNLFFALTGQELEYRADN